MDILQKMLERAQQNPQRIVLPEGDEPRTLEAANILLRDKIAKLILIGPKAKIEQMSGCSASPAEQNLMWQEVN